MTRSMISQITMKGGNSVAVNPIEARRFGGTNIAIDDIVTVTTSRRVTCFTAETVRLDASQVFKAQYEEIYYKDIQSIR